MNKTYIELAAETVNAMINKGLIRIPVVGKASAEEYNNKAVHTVGWALLEMYREYSELSTKAKQPRKEPAKELKSNATVVK